MEVRPLAPSVAPLARLAVSVALATCVLLLLVSSLFLLRRLTGGFARGLDSPAFLSCGAVLLAAVAMPRLAGWRLTPASLDGRLRLALLALPTLAAIMLAAALTFPAAPLWPLLLVWLGIAMEEAVWWSLYFRRRRPRGTEAGSFGHVGQAASLPVAAAHAALERDPELLASNVVQQITRVREEDGAESLSGMLRGDFDPGERTQNLHLAFCPPLASLPEFAFEQVDGPPATVKAAQVESFGVRLEVRLKAALEERSSVLVEFSARTGAQG